jgi:hypothetical protein
MVTEVPEKGRGRAPRWARTVRGGTSVPLSAVLVAPDAEELPRFLAGKAAALKPAALRLNLRRFRRREDRAAGARAPGTEKDVAPVRGKSAALKAAALRLNLRRFRRRRQIPPREGRRDSLRSSPSAIVAKNAGTGFGMTGPKYFVSSFLDAAFPASSASYGSRLERRRETRAA